MVVGVDKKPGKVATVSQPPGGSSMVLGALKLLTAFVMELRRYSLLGVLQILVLLE